MKDTVFLASLTSVGLFGKGNLKSEVKAKPTALEAAQHFLDEEKRRVAIRDALILPAKFLEK